MFQRVEEGTRTPDPWYHKPVLYQLSYVHHESTFQSKNKGALDFSNAPSYCTEFRLLVNTAISRLLQRIVLKPDAR